MMERLGFIRHGVTPWNQEGRFQGHSDIALAPEGVRQAEALAARLRADEGAWDIIYTSDLSRAAKTAQIIADALGLKEIHFDARLREVSGGLLDGTTEEERVSKWGEDWYDSVTTLGLETEEQSVRRGLQCIEDIVSQHPAKRILLVSHGTFLSYMLNQLIPNDPNRPHLNNTSLTTLIRDVEVWQCELYNCTKHLVNIS
ncbi:histidine phosphatase family protein [Paenibacillus terrigena]|uniref:histidine phosphatase family protein n=1 Tax=Paenibacillus terrigena TaxID=369333 RepID=UPI001FDEE264|nr:histidine phosphatase family protein [Paenibacillus terrigena]